MQTFAERAWYAYQCLPRDPRGRPLSYRSLEIRYDLPRSSLSRLFSGAHGSVDASNVPRLARALGVSVEWLISGHGAPPTAAGPVLPLSSTKESVQPEHDEDEGTPGPLPLRSLVEEANQRIGNALTLLAKGTPRDIDTAKLILRVAMSSLIYVEAHLIDEKPLADPGIHRVGTMSIDELRELVRVLITEQLSSRLG
jgi:hypothetical protein